jgi:nucleolar protein 56
MFECEVDVQEEPIIFDTEAGLLVIIGGKVIQAFPAETGEVRRESDYAKVGEWARSKGYTRARVNKTDLPQYLEKADLIATLISESELQELDSRKVQLMLEAKLVLSEDEAVRRIRERALTEAEEVLRKESSRPDLQLVQAIQALDEIDKFLNNTLSRVTEWYGLHFPELRELLLDELLMCKIILENGRRDGISKERLEGHGLSPKKVEAILVAGEQSKGGIVADRDLERIKTLAQIGLNLSLERDRLAGYVESAMTSIAPNVKSVAGATIGARLIAKAGGLDRLARLPASTIQILGAEKALFRALRTGSRPPKHGILFQHQEVHTAPKWQRGKIARTIANKVAIAARIDFYRGTEEGSLTGLLEERLKQIKIRYKDAPPVRPARAPRKGKKKARR